MWDIMLGDETYREWTKAFNPGSYYVGDWSKGSKMLFLGPDPESGKEGGMVSRIAENKKYEFISIEHLGLVKDGIEDTTGPEARKWAPAFENYTFKEKIGTEEAEVADLNSVVTELSVDMDITDEYKDMFSSMWNDALIRLKEMCEKG